MVKEREALEREVGRIKNVIQMGVDLDVRPLKLEQLLLTAYRALETAEARAEKAESYGRAADAVVANLASIVLKLINEVKMATPPQMIVKRWVLEAEKDAAAAFKRAAQG